MSDETFEKEVRIDIPDDVSFLMRSNSSFTREYKVPSNSDLTERLMNDDLDLKAQRTQITFSNNNFSIAGNFALNMLLNTLWRNMNLGGIAAAGTTVNILSSTAAQICPAISAAYLLIDILRRIHAKRQAGKSIQDALKEYVSHGEYKQTASDLITLCGGAMGWTSGYGAMYDFFPAQSLKEILLRAAAAGTGASAATLVSRIVLELIRGESWKNTWDTAFPEALKAMSEGIAWSMASDMDIAGEMMKCLGQGQGRKYFSQLVDSIVVGVAAAIGNIGMGKLITSTRACFFSTTTALDEDLKTRKAKCEDQLIEEEAETYLNSPPSIKSFISEVEEELETEITPLPTGTGLGDAESASTYHTFVAT